MRAFLNRWLDAAWRKLNPRDPVPALREENRALRRIAAQALAAQAQDAPDPRIDDVRRSFAEMVEAQMMCGSGPWLPQDLGSGDNPVVALPVRLAESLGLKEAGPVGDSYAQGANGMYELMLQNVGWQREINYSWLEFSRWGIQQIILITRLYRLKNPIMRRLINVCAEYVFARGCDITAEDTAANDQIKSFLKRNQRTLGRCALMEAEKAKDSDGNLFWVFFVDKSSGDCDIRTIDATEINDIWTDPEDADVPWLYQRLWTQRINDPATGSKRTESRQAWYPAIDYQPAVKPDAINGYPVMWETPIYHRKVGGIGKWLFGCPRMYPALDWAKEARRRLEACASQAQALAQFAWDVTTKGGQQAIEGWKQQMQTQAGPGMPLPDTNPSAIAGSSVIHGPGTKIDPVQVSKGEMDPERVRWYIIMCCMCKGVPPTFLGDMQTSNLATATSLDRPTETVFLAMQEEWIEDLTTIVTFALSKSLHAPNGKLREACANPGAITIRGAERALDGQGRMRYVEKKGLAKGDDIEVRVEFPAIREGDTPAQVSSVVQAMTLGNRGGQIVGTDEKASILQLSRLIDMDKPEETVESQYPSTGKDKYDPDRTKEILPPPIQKVQPMPGVQPQPAEVQATMDTQKDQSDTKQTKTAVKEAFARLAEAVGERLNGN